MALVLSGLGVSGKGIYMGAKAYTAQILLDRAWEETVHSGKPTLPWPWMDATPIAKISLPELDKTAIVLSEASGQALAFGPAHLSQTPRPGENGLSVIAAHKNTHFSFLKDLRTGDLIEITDPDGETKQFRMQSAEIVHKDQFSKPSVLSAGQKPTIALVTCYPFDSVSYGGPMRYIVLAELIRDPASVN